MAVQDGSRRLVFRVEPTRGRPMPATHVLYRHDDGRWFEARLVLQWRVQGAWRVQVAYSTAPGFTFNRCEPADSPRLAPVGTGEPHRSTTADIGREMEAAALRSRPT